MEKKLDDLIKRYGREKVLRAIKAVNAAQKTNKEQRKCQNK